MLISTSASTSGAESTHIGIVAGIGTAAALGTERGGGEGKEDKREMG